MTPEYQRNLAIGTIVVLILVAIMAIYSHNQWMKKHCVCTPAAQTTTVVAVKRASAPAAPGQRVEKFGDSDNWPSTGVFGNLADTNPYGNYAESREMYWPTYDEYNPYWTRA